MKKNLIRTALLLLLIIFSFFLYSTGKIHYVFIDNKTVTSEDKTFSALDNVSVFVDKEDSVVIKKRIRKQFSVSGKNHKITVTIKDNDGTEILIEKKFSLKLSEKAIISIPLLYAGEENWIEKEKFNP
ncbi:MAG: hypothetical protein H7A31_03065 [Thermotogae bacterium]|jgi:hypothetical protein|nr:hypothetical protein [Thermotogota bacterium]MCP5465656.1 hypothetical protein [Thermotogota bacterium]HOO74182.1 hypothetical protein [Tepiditoga sp.]